MGRASAPVRSARDNGSPGLVGAEVDEPGVVWRPGRSRVARARNGRAVPPVSRMSTFSCPGLPVGLNQISDPSPENPRLRRRFPGVGIGGEVGREVVEHPGAQLD